MKENATLTDLMADIECVRSAARELVRRPSNHAFHSKSGRRGRTRGSGTHFMSWIKRLVYLMLFSGFVWVALQVAQYLREMGGK
jgi:hypothetical protein